MKRLLILFTLLVFLAVAVQAVPVDLRNYIDSGSTYSSSATLTAAEQSSDIVSVVGARTIACDILIASIGTNIVVRLQCSNDDTNYMNCDSDGNDITITGNGQYSIIYTTAAVHRYYKLYWVSESGGAPTIVVSFRVGDAI